MHSKFKNQRGQGLIEYLIIVALIAVAGISVVGLMGRNIRVQFAKVSTAIQGKKSEDIQTYDVRKMDHDSRDLSDFFKGTANRE